MPGIEKLRPVLHEKVWGSADLEPWFDAQDRKIGEVWFTADGELPLLVKFIFTSDKLSVQVHPDDEQARRLGAACGKTEMWHVLRAAPGAQIALGFEQPVARESIREAVSSGEIERLLKSVPADPGATYFVPAGTVHALGAGIAVCEVQQNSDITYRLYDYGRPRELHLEKALEVAHTGTHPGASKPVPIRGGGERLAECEHFTVDLFKTSAPLNVAVPGRYQIAVVLHGSGYIADALTRQGDAWLIPAGHPDVSIAPDRHITLLRCYSDRE